jgi:hypothetical protein
MDCAILPFVSIEDDQGSDERQAGGDLNVLEQPTGQPVIGNKEGVRDIALPAN